MVATFTVDDILKATNGRLQSGKTNYDEGKLVWDLDELEPGDWYINTTSPRTDPQNRLKEAIKKGALGCIVNQRSHHTAEPKHATIISVLDTRMAVIELVGYWRRRVEPQVVGVTGSTGRWAVMILLNQLLKDKLKTHIAFMGNLGWFGCLKEVLSMPRETDVLIFEAGAIEAGEIDRISGALDPDLAILTQIRHPLPSPQRNARFASLYCELLERLLGSPNKQFSAVVYDENESVQKHLDQVLTGFSATRHSLCGIGMADRISDSALNELSEAMQSAIGQPVSRADLWCAIEAAKALGVTTSDIEVMLELERRNAQPDATHLA
ncbi:MAG: hypothetical protein K2X81_20145 [Candidatus Obscuribacterales bacterium]|nr:hypothetical protein [Candidatus Obscuribacterales bacterium]